MRKHTIALVLAAALAAAAAIAPALYAQDSPTMRHGMMGDHQMGGMMGTMSQMMPMRQMMGHCNNMMQNRGGGRPNEQWRRRSPTAPDEHG